MMAAAVVLGGGGCTVFGRKMGEARKYGTWRNMEGWLREDEGKAGIGLHLHGREEN